MELEDLQTSVHDWWSKRAPEHDLDVTVYYGDPDTAPERGQDCYYDSDWDGRDRTEPPTATYLTVPRTYWGSYNDSSTYERSNYEALQRDYPDTFIVRQTDNSQELLLSFNTYIPDTLGEAIEHILTGFLYDEEHHWELEQRLLREWWDDRGFDGEYKYTVQQLLADDEYEYPLDDLKVTDEWLEAEWWRLVREYDDATVCDDAETVYFRDEVVSGIAHRVVDQIIADWNARVTWLADRQEGLFT